MNGTIELLLVDDSREFLAATERFLRAEPLVTVVGCARSGDEGVELARRLRPHVVLMDLVMPGMSGLEATRRIKADADPPRVIVVTLHDSAGYRAAARSAGADGFVGKSDLATALLPLIMPLHRPVAGVGALAAPEVRGDG